MNPHTLVAESHVNQGLLVVVAASATTTEVVHLLALQFVLDAFAVWGIPNERKNRTNALDEQSALRRLRIIQSGLQSRQCQ